MTVEIPPDSARLWAFAPSRRFGEMVSIGYVDGVPPRLETVMVATPGERPRPGLRLETFGSRDGEPFFGWRVLDGMREAVEAMPWFTSDPAYAGA